MTYQISRSILEALRHGLRTLEAAREPLTPVQAELLHKLRHQITQIEALAAAGTAPKPPRAEEHFRPTPRVDFDA